MLIYIIIMIYWTLNRHFTIFTQTSLTNALLLQSPFSKVPRRESILSERKRLIDIYSFYDCSLRMETPWRTDVRKQSIIHQREQVKVKETSFLMPVQPRTYLQYPLTFELCIIVKVIDYAGLVQCPENVCLIVHQKTKLHADHGVMIIKWRQEMLRSFA